MLLINKQYETVTDPSINTWQVKITSKYVLLHCTKKQHNN